MGLPKDCTAGARISAKDRLQAIGNGWDVNVVKMLLRFSKLVSAATRETVSKQSKLANVESNVEPTVELSETDRLHQAALAEIQESEGDEAVCDLISKLPVEKQHRLMKLLTDMNRSKILTIRADSGGSVLDSGAARHVDNRTTVTNHTKKISLTSFGGNKLKTCGEGYLPIEVEDQRDDSKVMINIGEVNHLEGDTEPILSLGQLLRTGWEFHFTDQGQNCVATTTEGHKINVELGSDNLLRLPHVVRTNKGAKSLSRPENPVSIVRRTADQASYSFLHEMFNHSSAEKVYQTLGVTCGYRQIRLPATPCNACAQGAARRKGISHKRHNDPSINKITSVTVAEEDTKDARMDKIYETRAEMHAAWDKSQAELMDCIWERQKREARVLTVTTDTSGDNNLTEDDYNVNQEDDSGTGPANTVSAVQYESEVAGRSLPAQKLPRFDLEKLKPFEVMFVDNKSYPCAVRGGAKYVLVFIDYKTRAKFKIDITRKHENFDAFQEMIVTNGVHKLPYKCTVYHDGCGSMEHVARCARQLGIDHQPIPPHEQSLNEAEKVCDKMFAAARTHLLSTGLPDSYFSLALDYAMYVDLRMATTASRDWKTPYEMIKGTPPDITHIRPFGTKTFVTVPKQKRTHLEKKGKPLIRAEGGRLVGFQTPWSRTARVMLDGNRLVHSMNATFDNQDRVEKPNSQEYSDEDEEELINLEDLQKGATMPQTPSVASAGCSSVGQSAPGSVILPGGLLSGIPISHMELPAGVPIGRMEPPSPESEYHEVPEGEGEWLTHAGTPKQRPRPKYSVLQLDETEELNQTLDSMTAEGQKTDFNMLMLVADDLAVKAQKDMNWKKALSGPDRDKVIAAYDKEVKSLLSTILKRLGPDSTKYETAVKEAISGRALLDIKRNGTFKCRIVKQGFKEDKKSADGPEYNYYAHTARFDTVRSAIFRTRRRNRRLALKDVSTAFLQAFGYRVTDPGLRKYLKVKNPLTGEWEYYE